LLKKCPQKLIHVPIFVLVPCPTQAGEEMPPLSEM
jgi:hypothetical protein